MNRRIDILRETIESIADDCRRRLRKGFDNGDTNTLRKCEEAARAAGPTPMTVAELDIAKEALSAFIDNERDQGATSGIAYSLAESMLEEIEAGGENCLQNLPELKAAILNYCIEQENMARSDRHAEGESTQRNH